MCAIFWAAIRCPPKAGLFDACIRDQVVMVTGAGGSIGSELCRQIIGLGPKRLVLFEMSELALYNIERELRTFAEQNSLHVELVGLIGNAHHKHRMREIFLAYRVQTVYHAAAYKHVPIVEQNVIEGIYNNVIATWYTAEAAHETEVETFVLVSTDKAVNPDQCHGRDQALCGDGAARRCSGAAARRGSAWCVSATCWPPRARWCRCSTSRSRRAAR